MHATVEVWVTPRSARPSLAIGPRGIEVHVRAAPRGGAATEEARRLLAAALGVPPNAVALRSGGRSRVKRFRVGGLSSADVAARIAAV